MNTITDPTKITSCYKKERFRVAVKLSEFNRHFADSPLTNEYLVAGEPDRTVKTFKRLGRWLCGKESGWCVRIMRTPYRLNQLTDKLKERGIRYQVLSFIA